MTFMHTLTLSVPAKLNRFLHIVGRRDDGYHQLQTIFHLIDYCDTLTFTPRKEPDIELHVEKDPNSLMAQPLHISDKHNLVMRAARLLQQTTHAKRLGVHITLTKKIPLGGGLGGGSADAAATLLALNRLWELDLPLSQLEQMGEQLGADVPFFVRGHSAWGEGIGERLTEMELPETWFLVLVPPVHVATIEIFCDEQLTRNTPVCKIAPSLIENGHNDCEPVVRRLYPEVAAAIDWLEQFSPARMTGSGGCVFAAFTSAIAAQEIAQRVPAQWGHFVARGLNVSPVNQALELLKVSGAIHA